jgi:hypothetical protein
VAAGGQSGSGVGFEASAISAYLRKLESTLDDDARRRIMRAAGGDAKKGGLSAAEDTLGSDRAMRNFKGGRVPLRLGYDEAGWQLSMNHRPSGVWFLAERGRRNSGPIYPRANGRKARRPTAGRVVVTPQGPRASSSYGPSRGLRTFTIAAARERKGGTDGAWRALQAELRRITKG